MARDYRRLLELSEDLQAFTGYVDGLERKRLDALRAEFDNERVKLVYKLFKEGSDAEALRESVVADLGRIGSSLTEYSPGAIAEALDALLAEIDAQAGSSPGMRSLLRWGPVALAVVGAGVYIYLRTRQ
jgi:hypothetical protein